MSVGADPPPTSDGPSPTEVAAASLIRSDPEAAPIVADVVVLGLTSWAGEGGNLRTDVALTVVGIVRGDLPSRVVAQLAGGTRPDGSGQKFEGSAVLNVGSAYRLAMDHLPDGWPASTADQFYVVGGEKGVLDGPPDSAPPALPPPVAGCAGGSCSAASTTAIMGPRSSRGCENDYCIYTLPLAAAARPFVFNINEDTIPATLDRTAVVNAFRFAAGSWQSDQNGARVSGAGALSFAYGGSWPNTHFAQNGRNVIAFVAQLSVPGCPQADSVACTAWWVDPAGNIIEADMEFNTGNFQHCVLPCALGSVSYDIQTTAAHEFGHVLGMDHNTVTTNSVVTPLPIGIARRSLFIADRNAVTRQYPPTVFGFTHIGQGGPTPSPMTPGLGYAVSVDMRNDGNTAWPLGGLVRLGTASPRDRTDSPFAASWFAPNRSVAVNYNVSEGSGTRSVQPGQIGRFTFVLTPQNSRQGLGPAGSPGATLARQEYFDLVADSLAWAPSVGLYWQTDVGSFYGSYGGLTGPSGAVAAGTTFSVTLKARNAGTAAWPIGLLPLTVGVTGDRISAYKHSSWPTDSRPGRITQNLSTGATSGWVLPGQDAAFTFTMQVPTGTSIGRKSETFDLVAESNRHLTEAGTYTINFCVTLCL